MPQKMSKFELFGVGRILFGRGEFRRAGELAVAIGHRAMILYNGSGQVEQLVEMLTGAGVSSIVRRQRGEPIVADVDGATDEARRAACDVVIGLGGGSAIDAAKAVAGLLGNGGSAVDYIELVGKGQKITRPAVPWIAIPTTAGTGAEATRNAVIGFPEKQFKASIRSELLLPRIALVDPELGVAVPPDVTARSGMDALCQLIESYTSIGANPVTDSLALAGIPLASRSLHQAYSDGSDLNAREDMALAALLSGMTLTSAGLGAVHGFAAPIGANFPAPHGAVCAALLPHSIRENILALRECAGDGMRALSRYATIGRLLIADAGLADREAADVCVRFTERLGQELHIPLLQEFGMKTSDVPRMVSLAKKASSMRYNPIVLSDETLGTVLTAAITSDDC
jgi:alcohol dehydrogenase class IV